MSPDTLKLLALAMLGMLMIIAGCQGTRRRRVSIGIGRGSGQPVLTITLTDEPALIASSFYVLGGIILFVPFLLLAMQLTDDIDFVVMGSGLAGIAVIMCGLLVGCALQFAVALGRLVVQ